MRAGNPALLVIVGPTAVGKTALSIQLAERFAGEVISADSRLFYRGLDIGTAKPTPEERAKVTHHLIDICRPDETLTLGEYQRQAYQAIDEVQRRGRLPMMVGGTGQYVMAVVEGWGIPKVAPQRQLRRALKALGGPELARWLAHLDPTAAESIHPRNVRRVIRALEVTLVTGRPITQLQRKRPPPYAILVIGLTCERELLYQRIDRRVEQMIADGLVHELQALRAAGFGANLPAMSGLGYRQLHDYLDGESALEEAVERIKFETHRFVRQQYTWFRTDDPAISWYDVAVADWQESVEREVEKWLDGQGEGRR